MLGTDTEKETLQYLFKSCLLDLDKLKIEISELKSENYKLIDNNAISSLEAEILNKENEIEQINAKVQEEISLLNKNLNEKDQIIKEKDNKIYELDYINNSLDEIKEYFASQLKDFKKKELIDINERLDDAKNIIAEKNATINSMQKELDLKNIEVIKLESSIDSKMDLMTIKHELDKNKEELYQKEAEINLLKEGSISKDEFFKLKQELTQKDEKIKRLEEVTEFFNDVRNDEYSRKPPSLRKSSDE